MDTTANVMGAGIATVMAFPTTGIVTVMATACVIGEIVGRITRVDTKQVIDASYTPLRRGFLLVNTEPFTLYAPLQGRGVGLHLVGPFPESPFRVTKITF